MKRIFLIATVFMLVSGPVGAIDGKGFIFNDLISGYFESEDGKFKVKFLILCLVQAF